MNSPVQLVLLSVVMAITSYMAGAFPLKVPHGKNIARIGSILSMGLLVGTSLVIVIPEGIESLYDSTSTIGDNPRYVGFSLLAGFVTMYLIDNFASIWRSLGLMVDADSSKLEPNTWSGKALTLVKTSLTLGLLVHSAVDGISLGSAYAKGDATLGVVFFLAIIIHKLPTAFSLVSILIKEGLHPSVIQLHLVVFSLTSPVFAISAYLFLSLLKFDTEFTVSLLLLYSGGTFLYIVTHVLLESSESEQEYRPPSDDSQETVSSHHVLTGLDILISVVGMILPVLFSFLSED